MGIVKQVRGKQVRIVGEQHTGWLPAGAAPPQSLPTRNITVDVRIEDTGSGFLLLCEAQDAPYYFDTWHLTIEEAQAQAEHTLGIAPSEWK